MVHLIISHWIHLVPDTGMDQTPAALLPVEVAYAEPEKQYLITLELPEGSTIWDAVQQSGLLNKCPGLTERGESLRANVGVFGQLKPAETVLRANDRVEIYRPLLLDPKEARRLRAEADKQQ